MAVVRTDEWLDKDFTNPVGICKRFLKEFNESEPKPIYDYLSSFGMYRPNRATFQTYERLKEKKVWETINHIYEKYRGKWNGPEVTIYIFPISQSSNFFFRERQSKKSGVSFPDRVFLFIGDLEDELELESLFVHEYHHVCRIRKQKKDPSEFTFLDSMILEGLAELEVEKSCGAEYLADWCHFYSKEDIELYMKRYIISNLQVKKTDPLHDQLLFGTGAYPKLLGYACGYYLVRTSYKENYFSTKTSFTILGKRFITKSEET
ncbi:DUF2268 domain-containing protein [Robertmurraya korlensis]|uniref:DUF2268 domain-containing protein n=1 Tax=Robertmurraya korlensis TaxID=519977 RepID=UPI00082512B9|nr:DUF2268 domain-containing putative Zn-dependent protease [Robertmurraya korlensis]